MTDTTEARRLADDLLDDADQGQAHIPSLRKSDSMLRALADENGRMREALSEYVRAFEAHQITNTHGARDFDFTGRIAALAREAMK